MVEIKIRLPPAAAATVVTANFAELDPEVQCNGELNESARHPQVLGNSLHPLRTGTTGRRGRGRGREMPKWGPGLWRGAKWAIKRNPELCPFNGPLIMPLTLSYLSLTLSHSHLLSCHSLSLRISIGNCLPVSVFYLFLSVSVSMPLSLSVPLSASLSINIFVPVPLYLSVSVSLSICLYVCLSISVSLFAYQSLCLNLCLYLSLRLYLSVSLSASLSFSLSFSLCLSFCLSVSLSAFVSFSVSLCLSLYPPVCLYLLFLCRFFCHPISLFLTWRSFENTKRKNMRKMDSELLKAVEGWADSPRADNFSFKCPHTNAQFSGGGYRGRGGDAWNGLCRASH